MSLESKYEGENEGKKDILEYTSIPMLKKGINALVQALLEWQGKRYSQKVEKKQNFIPRKVLRDIVRDGEKMCINLKKIPKDQVINALREVFCYWSILEEQGHSPEKILQNIKKYFEEILKGENEKKNVRSSGLFLGDLEEVEDICVEQIKSRLNAQQNLENLFRYGTTGNSYYPVSFELLQKLGSSNIKIFFTGTNTEKFSQFDFVVMGIFDAIRRELWGADKRKRNKEIFIKDGSHDVDTAHKSHSQSIINNYIDPASDIAKKNIKYYIGVLQLLFRFGKENGYEAFSVNVGEYYKKVFSIGFTDCDLIHELTVTKEEIEKIFGVSRIKNSPKESNIIQFPKKFITISS